ncbi:MAG: 30S ribosomal protein S14 [Holosporales bacterium]|jgi:small subunit ribosomal protein S14|nr:30S ribosomal protein S14 [Holosporales bacterium]
MARKSSIQHSLHIERVVRRHKTRRAALKRVVMDKKIDPTERFQAQLKLSALPRNGAASRMRNRCLLTGRARGVYRKFRLSRLMFREMASAGLLPGIRKASW